MCSVFETSDVVDVSDDIECDVTEPADTTDEIDDMLDGMSLDELYELRDSLTDSDVSDTEDKIPDISDITPIEEAEVPDYSFHWDGETTHNTEWDDDPEPTEYTKKLTR